MSVEVKTPTKTRFDHEGFQCREHCFSAPEPVRTKDDSSVRSDTNRFAQPWSRKRRYSQTYRRDSYEGIAKRKRLKSLDKPLPTRFLLGGSIDDPLNLNGLENSEVGRVLNQKTPQSSPLPIPLHNAVEVRVPANITDPLNLNDGNEETDISKLCRKKKHRHNRHKKRDNSINKSHVCIKQRDSEKKKDLLEALKIDIEPEMLPAEVANASAIVPPPEVTKHRKSCDRIVSPVIRQISPKNKKRRRTNSGSKPDASSSISKALLISPSPSSTTHTKTPPKKFYNRQFSKVNKQQRNGSREFKKQPKFIYGNYNRYYGYRNATAESDHRLQCFNQEWFEGKSVLDIGCNVGHLTLAIARDFHPSKIVGIDIDNKLISAARKNIRYYMSSNATNASKFPISNLLNYGPIEAPPITRKHQPTFPQNVLFMQGNYVLECDELLEMQKEEYDVVLALSITKWIHFNWGDGGLKRFFKRIYRQLRPGGKLILEPQPWSSYKKKKKLSDEIFANFRSIRLRPDKFSDYLLSKDIGFSTSAVVDVPFHSSKGFRRPIQLFTKPETVENSPYPEFTYGSQPLAVEVLEKVASPLSHSRDTAPVYSREPPTLLLQQETGTVASASISSCAEHSCDIEPPVIDDVTMGTPPAVSHWPGRSEPNNSPATFMDVREKSSASLVSRSPGTSESSCSCSSCCSSRSSSPDHHSDISDEAPVPGSQAVQVEHSQNAGNQDNGETLMMAQDRDTGGSSRIISRRRSI